MKLVSIAMRGDELYRLIVQLVNGLKITKEEKKIKHKYKDGPYGMETLGLGLGLGLALCFQIMCEGEAGSL